jgi:transposase
MIHLAAMVTIRKKGIMRTYYMRKIAEGKNKMAIINAIRNKLIHILIACINKDTIYVKNYKKTLD